MSGTEGAVPNNGMRGMLGGICGGMGMGGMTASSGGKIDIDAIRLMQMQSVKELSDALKDTEPSVPSSSGSDLITTRELPPIPVIENKESDDSMQSIPVAVVEDIVGGATAIPQEKENGSEALLTTEVDGGKMEIDVQS